MEKSNIIFCDTQGVLAILVADFYMLSLLMKMISHLVNSLTRLLFILRFNCMIL